MSKLQQEMSTAVEAITRLDAEVAKVSESFRSGPELARVAPMECLAELERLVGPLESVSRRMAVFSDVAHQFTQAIRERRQ